MRSQLLVWLLVPLAIAAGLDVWVTFQSAEATATLVHDRLLLGSARTIAEQVNDTDGHLSVTVPPAALEMLDAGYRDRIYYRISGPDGHLIAGYAELAVPSQHPAPEFSVGFDSILRGQTIRVIAFSQPVLGPEARGPVLIEVAQTLTGSQTLARQIWLHAVREQLLMLLLVGSLLWIGLRRGLRPLIALRDRMLRREPLSLESIEVVSVPSELHPVIAALNQYARRLNEHMQLHSRFIADASHQLRTPLAVLNMQVTFALRQNDPEVAREVLRAIRESVQGNIRLVNQLLAFTEAESELSPPPRKQVLDLCAALCSVIEELASLAQSRAIDLGFEASETQVRVFASEHLIRMLAANLIDNALRYTQPGGIVTVHVHAQEDGGAVMEVVDNGPGIPEAERERVFERFYRLGGARSDGCGLGLSIVREVATVCNAEVRLTSASDSGGVRVTVRFPPVPATAPIDPRADGTALLNAPDPGIAVASI